MKVKVLIFIILFLFFLSGFFTSLSKEKIFVFNNNIKINLQSKDKNLKPKIFENRVWEINLSKKQIYFFENGNLKEIIPIAYQSPEGVWYQTPTGYFRVGIKKTKHFSSIFPVYMNYSVQMYEDFFIHDIPYYLNGERVDSDFTGGCIRLWPKFAKEFFEKVKPGDLIISYKDLDDFEVKEDFIFPVNKNEFYIRQRFNNPLRTSWFHGLDRSLDYIQHAGIDLAPYPDVKDLNVYNIYDGKVVKIVRNGKNDHGLGNVVITQINVDTTQINADKYINDNQYNKNQRSSVLNPRLSAFYALYAHLSEINPNLKEGDFIKKGEIIGKVGATGYGCNYWRIGEDGCDKNSLLDIHLHFEIKTKPVLESPIKANCFINNKWNICYGYTPKEPQYYGYIDPLKFLGKN